MIAATGMGTTSAEARAVLGARLEIAAAIEGGAPLPAPLPGLANSYLHFGKDEPDLRAELDVELAPYTGIEVTLSVRATSSPVPIRARSRTSSSPSD